MLALVTVSSLCIRESYHTSTSLVAASLQAFHTLHANQSPAMLQRLQQAVIENQNVFAVLMDAVRVCSLGQITNALFEVGGQYRRNM